MIGTHDPGLLLAVRVLILGYYFRGQRVLPFYPFGDCSRYRS